MKKRAAKLGESLDSALLYQVKKLITGANVHTVRTWLFAYETTSPGPLRENYERVLRDFVKTQQINIAALQFAKIASDRSRMAREKSDILNRIIDKKQRNRL